jgi:hypothetical protein
MPDRRMLAAPVLAQVASFVVVLVIGGFTGHSAARGTPGPTPGSPVPHASTSPRAGATGAQPGLAVQVPVGGIVLHIPVRVLDSRTMSAVASGTLSPNAQGTQLGWTRPLPAGTYQVCARPPAGLRFTDSNTGVLPGWDCTVADVLPGSQALVTFHLAQDAA